MSAKHLVAAIFAAVISVPLSAQTVKAGITAWQNADYAAAVAIWRPLAERGDPDAQFNLGQAYRLGRGVPLDLAMAKSWFEKAADTGHIDAETTLGLLLFQNGDRAAGLKWLRRAAEEGEPRALLVYGTALYNGEGVAEDRVLGYAYVSRAAGQGLAPAKDTLAQLDSLMPEADRRKAHILAEQRWKAATKVTASVTKQAQPQHPRRQAELAKELAAPRPLAEQKPALRGAWRIQLGAFAQRSSAESLYRRLSTNGALSGRSAIYVPNGSVTRLQLGPFETKAAALQACASLKVACFPVAAK